MPPLAGLLPAGCASYYRVTGVPTGRVYYTGNVDRAGAGAVSFKDNRTGGRVTPQNSGVQQVTKEEYLTGRAAPPAAAAK